MDKAGRDFFSNLFKAMSEHHSAFLERLTTESIIGELPFWEVTLSVDHTGKEAARCFEQERRLPGIFLRDGETYVGIISRERFYENVVQMHGSEVFYNGKLRHFLKTVPAQSMQFDYRTSIVNASEACLKRSMEFIYEPLVVIFPDRLPGIIDYHDLNLAQTWLLGLAKEIAQEQKRAADEANLTKSRFLTTMSHELRTPLTAILGYAQLVKQDTDQANMPESSQRLIKLQSVGKYLLNLIEGVLDLSKIEAGKTSMQIETFEIKELIQEVETTIAPLAALNHNEFHVVCPDSPGEMTADLVKVRQILFNLLSNASKFTKNGVITLDIERIDNGQSILFRVRDTGIGMSKEEMEKIFEPFVQADSSTTRRYGGTGLGLAVTKHFCAMMGGEITVESEPQKGTVFLMRLPSVVSTQPMLF